MGATKRGDARGDSRAFAPDVRCALDAARRGVVADFLRDAIQLTGVDGSRHYQSDLPNLWQTACAYAKGDVYRESAGGEVAFHHHCRELGLRVPNQ